MVGSVLHYTLGCEVCELHFCTMQLSYKHHFIYQKLIGSHIRGFVFFIVKLKHFWALSKYGKNALLQVFVNHSSGHYATKLKSTTCGKPTFACIFIVMCLS